MSNPASGGVASSQNSNVARRQRLRELALETVDLNNDPYFMRNHLGSYECKLCLTLHMNEGSYLAHTQGKRHQQNLKRRDWRKAKEDSSSQPILRRIKRKIEPRKTQKIGTPGYKVVKQRDAHTRQLSLLFRIHYPQIENGLQPRHRFMSTFEQNIDIKDKRFQCILFAAEPYSTIGFKIPNNPIEKDQSKLFTHWNPRTKHFTFQLYFERERERERQQGFRNMPANLNLDD
jgi:splicing factor 3A subunit 2